MVASVSKFKQNSSRTMRGARGSGRLDFPKLPALFALPAVKMPFFRSTPCLFLAAAVIALAALTGCGEDDPRLAYGRTQYLGGVYGDSATAPTDNVSYWDGEGVPGKPTIKISLAEQRAYFYKSGQLVGISQLSTGREGLDTPAGQYKITQKDVDHASSRYGDYVDANDNVVVPNIDNEKDKKLARDPLQRRADAVFHAHRRGHRHACRLSARLPRIAWLHSNAGIHGGGFF